MRRLILILALLGGCDEVPQMTTTEVTPLRDPAAPIASQVDVTAGRLAGDWGVVAGFDRAPAGPGPGSALRLEARGEALVAILPGGECRAGVCFETETRVDLTPDGPGRWRSVGGGWLPSGPVWVLWMDADNRTAVIGRPDGAAAWIMNRDFAENAARVAAGRDILDWFGYDMSRLEEVVR